MTAQNNMSCHRIRRNDPILLQLFHDVFNQPRKVALSLQLTPIAIRRIPGGLGQHQHRITIRRRELPRQPVELQRRIDIVMPAVEPEDQIYLPVPLQPRWDHQQNAAIVIMTCHRSEHAVTVQPAFSSARVRKGRVGGSHPKGLIPLILLRQQGNNRRKGQDDSSYPFVIHTRLINDRMYEAFQVSLIKINPMYFLVLGILILVAGFVIAGRADARRYSRPVQIIGLLIALAGLSSASFVQIDAGEVGVQTLYGKVQNEVLASGLHFINPLMEVHKMDVKTQNYTMSAVRDEGAREGDDAIRVLSSDGLEVVIDLTVLYRVLPTEAPRIMRETGLDYTDKIVRPLTRTRIRDNAVYYDAVSLYSTKRDEFQRRIFESITGEFQKRGLVLEQLLIRNISLPQAVKSSIEQKMTAEQDAQKMQYVLQKEQQEAQRKRVEAQGIADYQRIISESLTDRQLQYESIKAQLEIAKSANAKVIILGKGSTPVMLDTKN